MEFKDLFSGHAKAYALYRPHYPRTLFSHLANIAPDRELAWDVGTGSGQAADELVQYFNRVIATDASEAQLSEASPHPKIEYRVKTAEDSGIEGETVSLITVAQALHWFDLEAFFREARRVAKPHARFAAWSYGLAEISPALDQLTRHFHDVTLGPFWDPERRRVGHGMFELKLPLLREERPAFAMELELDLAGWMNYLGTWSALKKAEKATGQSPLAERWPEFETAWGDPLAKRLVRWPLAVRIGELRS